MCNQTEMHQQSQTFDRTHVPFPIHFCFLAWQQLDSLTFSFLITGGLNETLELYVDMDLNAQEESHFEQHQLELTNTCNTKTVRNRTQVKYTTQN